MRRPPSMRQPEPMAPAGTAVPCHLLLTHEGNRTSQVLALDPRSGKGVTRGRGKNKRMAKGSHAEITRTGAPGYSLAGEGSLSAMPSWEPGKPQSSGTLASADMKKAIRGRQSRRKSQLRPWPLWSGHLEWPALLTDPWFSPSYSFQRMPREGQRQKAVEGDLGEGRGLAK